jgi:hypothetical protein
VKEWLASARQEERALACSTIGLVPGEEAARLLRASFEQAAPAERKALLEAMIGRREDFRDVFTAALRAEDAGFRELGLRGLLAADLLADEAVDPDDADGELASERIRSACEHDDSPGVRRLALVALAVRDGDSGRELLRRRLLEEADSDVRALAGALLLLGSADSQEELSRVRGAVAAERNPVLRAGLEELAAALAEPERRRRMLEDLDRDLRIGRLASGGLPANSAKNPFALEERLSDLLRRRLAGSSGK